MVTLNESKVNHYCNTKGNCADPGGLQPLGLQVRIPRGAWMSVYFECCSLSGRGLCYGAIIKQLDVPRSVTKSVMNLKCCR
jgi:hypothetical protein